MTPLSLIVSLLNSDALCVFVAVSGSRCRAAAAGTTSSDADGQPASEPVALYNRPQNPTSLGVSCKKGAPPDHERGLSGWALGAGRWAAGRWAHDSLFWTRTLGRVAAFPKQIRTEVIH